MSGSHYAPAPMPMIGPPSNEEGVLLGDWMALIENRLASLEGSHWGDPCIFCGQAHDDVAAGPCPGTRLDSAARMELSPPDETTQYDLRTATEHEADELAALRMRLDNAVDALEVTALRVSRLEELVAVQREAIERQADALTVIQLRAGL